MPTHFFEIIINDQGIGIANRVIPYGADLPAIEVYLNKYNKYFNKIKYSNVRLIRIYVCNEDSPHIIQGLNAKSGYITINYKKYPIKRFLMMSNDEKKEALINIMYDASKIIFDEVKIDFSEMELCFNNLWASDYKTYHTRVSKIHSSPLKTYRFYFWHVIEFDTTDVYWVVENTKIKVKNIYLIYSNELFDNSCFEYFQFNPKWVKEDIFLISNETGEVIHQFNLTNGTYDVMYYPMPSWSVTYLQLKLKKEISKDHIERRQISKEMDIEFKKLQEQVWLRGIR